MGPLLFPLYVNDMANVSSVLFTLLFADDTNVFVEGICLDNLTEGVNDELCKISEWMAINKLSLNVKKTKCMIFSLRKNPYHQNEFHLMEKSLIKFTLLSFWVS